MPRLSAEEYARREASAAALRDPTIPATEQAIADADAHLKARREAEALTALTAPEADSGKQLPPGYVHARILKQGHNKIYTGQIEGTNPDPEGKFTRFKFGDVVSLPLEIAQAQENRGMVEIQEA